MSSATIRWFNVRLVYYIDAKVFCLLNLKNQLGYKKIIELNEMVQIDPVIRFGD